MLLDLNLDHDNVFVIEGLQGNELAYFNLAKEKKSACDIAVDNGFSGTVNVHS